MKLKDFEADSDVENNSILYTTADFEKSDGGKDNSHLHVFSLRDE